MQAKASFGGRYRVGCLTLDMEAQRVLIDGQPVPVTRKNFELLRELVLAQGGIVTREQLTTAVWPDTTVEEATLRQNVYTLRNLLRQADPGREYLETIPKVGYRITLPVEEIRDEQAVAPPPPETAVPTKIPRRRWAMITAVLLAAFGAAVAGWYVKSAGSGSALARRAAELVRQGFLLVDHRNGEHYPAALALFDDAIAADPAFAPAHAGKALVYALEDREPEALAEADAVARLDPASGAPFAIRGFLRIYRWDWPEAGRLFDRVEQRPCPDPFCHQWRAFYLGLMGQLAPAIREIAGAVESFPARLSPRAEYGRLLYWAGDKEDAARELKTVTDASGTGTHARWHLWKVQFARGDRVAASHDLMLAMEPAWYRLPPEDDFRVLRAREDLFGTPEFFRRLVAIGAAQRSNPYFLAEIATAAGDTREAIHQLQAAYQGHVFFLPYAKRDPLFAPLHGNADYEAIMKRIGL